MAVLASRTEAKDAIQALVKTVTDAEALTVVYEDVDSGTPDQQPADLGAYVRVLTRHRQGDSTSLPSPSGVQRYMMRGFVIIEIMTPLADGNVVADDLAQKFDVAFRTRSALNQNVWYTDVISQEIGATLGYFKTNVIAEFHYDLFT